MILPLAMQFPQTFLPTAREVGLLAIVTELFLTAAMFAFLAASVFFLITRTSVHPSFRAAAALSAVACLVSAAAYWYLRYYDHDILHAVAITEDSNGKRHLIHDAFFVMGQYRFMNWLVTLPLLLLRTASVLKVKPREISGRISLLLAACVWMLLAAFIGDQQFSADGAVLVGRRLLWGALAAPGLLALPYLLLWRMGPSCGGRAEDESGHIFRLMSLSTATTWAVYPLAYLAPAALPRLDLDWVQLALTAADLVNVIGLGAAAYLAGAEELARRSPPEAVQPVRLAS